MGWDIVAIGLNYNLPIDNPSAIAEHLIPLFNSPIDIGYYKDWELDPNTGIIKRSDTYEWKSLSLFKANLKGKAAKLTIENKSALDIFFALNKNINADNFKDISEYDGFMDCILNPYSLYELESADGYRWIRIFKDIFEFDIKAPYRWFQLVHLFDDYSPQSILLVEELREYIHWQCKITGCKKIFLFPDQDYGALLYDKINLTSEEWLKFMNNVIEEEIKNLKEGCKNAIFKISDYLCQHKILSPNEDIYCFSDEFQDK